MKLLLLFGDSAVGKMTVGQELCKITDLRLFHNHITIEPVLEVFGRFDLPVIVRLRDVYFEEFAKSGLYGMIHTFMWAFDEQEDWDYAAHIREIFEREGAEIYYAELVAPLSVRLELNTTANRQLNKPSKRNIELANRLLLDSDSRHRHESFDGELTFENYIKIDNSNLPPEIAAAMIKEKFAL